jgi:hypothetical protein
VPPSAAFDELRNFTTLPVEFQLVPERNYHELQGLRSAEHPSRAIEEARPPRPM